MYGWLYTRAEGWIDVGKKKGHLYIKVHLSHTLSIVIHISLGGAYAEADVEKKGTLGEDDMQMVSRYDDACRVHAKFLLLRRSQTQTESFMDYQVILSDSVYLIGLTRSSAIL